MGTPVHDEEEELKKKVAAQLNDEEEELKKKPAAQLANLKTYNDQEEELKKKAAADEWKKAAAQHAFMKTYNALRARTDKGQIDASTADNYLRASQPIVQFWNNCK